MAGCGRCGNQMSENTNDCINREENIQNRVLQSKSHRRLRRASALLALCAFVSTLFVGCTTNRSNSSNISSQETSSKQTTPQIKVGDTIVSENVDIAINGVELSYDVLPAKTNGFYTHYAADSGKVYIDIKVDVKNKQKQQMKCDKVMNVEAKYNNDFNYSGFAVVEDQNTGFTYANISAIDPLETKAMRFLVECPQEVEESESALVVKFKLGTDHYEYVIR